MYPSDMSDKEWLILAPLVKQTSGRPREHDIRSVLNAIFYVSRTGVQWRAIPKDYPDWQSCYGYFRRFSKSGKWDMILSTLHAFTRLKADKDDQPTVGIVDSQTVQTVQARDNLGYDAGKKKRP